MKKRLIGTLLLGALLVSSSSVFVSCSDYDDDIKDLQTQINSLSALITQKETTVNSSIDNLKSALTTLENASKAGDDATLEAAKKAVEDAKKALEDAIKANYDTQVAKNANLEAAILEAKTSADQALAQLATKADVTTVENLKNAFNAAKEELNAAISGKAAQAEVDALSAQLAQLQKDLADAQKALEEEIAKKADKTSVEALQGEVEQLKKDLAAAKAELQAAIDAKADQTTVTALENKVNDLKDALEKKDAELASLIEQNAAAIKSLQDKVDQLKKDLEAKDKELEAAIAKKADQKDLDALKTKVENLEAELKAKDTELANEIIAAKKDIKAVADDLDALEKKVGVLDTDLQKAISDIAALETALNGQKAALEAAKKELEGKIGDNATDIAANKAKIAEQATAISNLQNKVAALETELKNLIASEIAKVNTALEGKADLADFNALKTAHSTFEQKTNQALSALTGKVEALERSVTELGDEIASVDAKYATITAALAKSLRSLVYMPTLYVDGIESIEYPYLIDTAIVEGTDFVVTRQRNTPFAVFNENYVKTLRNGDCKLPNQVKLHDWYYPQTVSQEYFGPTWPVSYHMNPSQANPTWADVKGWNRRNAIEITRSTAGNNGAIQIANTYADGSNLFSVRDGIITVGLKVTDPKNLANHAITTEGVGRPGTYTEERVAVGGAGASWIEDGITYRNSGTVQYDDIIALQVKAKDFAEDPEKVITSDYAMIYPEAVWLEGIIWTKHNSKLGFSNVDYDEKCEYLSANAKKCHVWDTPQEALGIVDNTVYPDIELYYNNKNGIKLSDLLGLHYIKDTKIGRQVPGTMQFNSDLFKQFGLTYEFALVDYTIDGNSTHDSNYATIDPKDGTIIAKNVKEDGVTIDTESATSVDREPLVRVLVKRGSRVLFDGYILVHITRTVSPDPEEDLLVDNYPDQEFKWNLCDDQRVFTTNWSQFSYYVLTQKLENMTKDDFDLQYGKDYPGVPDLLGTRRPVTLSDNSQRYDDVAIWNDNNGKPGTQCMTRDLPGQVFYYHNSVGTTNHRFEWYLTDDELEEYTHDNGGKYLTTPRTITKWFRYTRATGQSSKYEHVWVKMTLKLTRGTIANTGIKEKNNNYWYKYTGNDNGWDAVIWNPWYPENGGNTKTFRQYLNSTFTGPNKVNFTNTGATYADNANDATRNARAKYYFTPYEFQITAQDGTKYTITARSGKNDERWNAFVCKYLRWENDGSNNRFNHINNDGTCHNLHWYSASNDKTYTEHKWGTPEQNKKIHQNCAIDYNDGVYTNATLYAVKSGSYSSALNYTPIATLNQNITSGQMDLIWRVPDDDITKEVLNAIGYEENNAQILKELHTMVGVIAHNGCFVALDVNEYVKDESNINAGTFYVSWKRPINVLTEQKHLSDAVNNGDSIPTLGFVQLFDWRGPVEGKMYDENQWLWAYYNVKSIIINTEPSKVKTNMHQTNTNTFVTLSSLTTDAELWTLLPDGSLTHSAPINLPTANGGTTAWPLMGYNNANMNNKLKADMGLVPEDIDKMYAFAGGIIYFNNGDHVTDFDVILPVTINYDWGRFTTSVKVHIHRTLGN